MEYTTLGETGLEVSEVCMGCMSFGSKEWREWVLSREEGIELVEHAIDQGINFFDTANMYSWGESESILGDAIQGHRDKLVIATKLFFEMQEDTPNSGGLSRKAIEKELSDSLDRLGIDSIDLYQIHRWDYDTPIRHTLSALTSAMQKGDIHYIGASSMWAHQFAEALHTADINGWERFATMQNHYNLVYREEEREMLPLCRKEDIGVIPWSPLARGYLTRPHSEVDATDRGDKEEYLYEHPYMEGGGPEINNRVQKVAEDMDLSMAQVALAWILSKDEVDAPIIGVTEKQHIDDAVVATEISLSESDAEYLEEPYESVEVSGHR